MNKRTTWSKTTRITEGVPHMNQRKRLSFALPAIAVAMLAALFIAVPSQAFAVTSAEKQAEADAAYAQLSDMQSVLDSKSDDYYNALHDRDDAIAAMNEAQAREDDANAQIAVLQDHLSERARAMYRTGSSTFIDVVLGASSFDDFVTTWDVLSNMNADDAACVENTKALEEEAASARQEYEEQAEVADQKLAEADQTKSDAEQTIASLQALTSSLDAEVATLVTQEQAAAAQAAADQAAAAQAAQAATATTTTTTNDDGTTTTTTTAGGTTTTTVTDENGDTTSETVTTDDNASNDNGGSSGGSYEGGSDAVSRAYACLGAPYVWGAAGPGGYDCSGLVSYCLTGVHDHIFTSSELNTYAAVSDPQPGDVCVRDGHCGIYIGGGQYINAADYGIGVIISSVPSDMKIVRP